MIIMICYLLPPVVQVAYQSQFTQLARDFPMAGALRGVEEKPQPSFRRRGVGRQSYETFDTSGVGVCDVCVDTRVSDLKRGRIMAWFEREVSGFKFQVSGLGTTLT
jgi:hypothetical protein